MFNTASKINQIGSFFADYLKGFLKLRRTGKGKIKEYIKKSEE